VVYEIPVPAIWWRKLFYIVGIGACECGWLSSRLFGSRVHYKSQLITINIKGRKTEDNINLSIRRLQNSSKKIHKNIHYYIRMNT